MHTTARRSAATLSVASLSAAFLVTALAVTLAPKALITDYAAGEDFVRLDEDIVRHLEDQGFAVTRRPEIGRPPTFYAAHGTCRIMIRHATAPGTYDRKYRQNAEHIGTLHYRIGRDRFDAPPLLHLWIADTLQASKLRLGLAGPRPAAIAIAHGADCPADAMATDDLMVYGKAAR